MNLRNETTHDATAIRTITIDAFGQSGEADLVERLRKDGDLIISVIAEVNNVPCGHIAMSRLKTPHNALALAPVSVITGKQGKGIGTRLVEQALEEARVQGFDLTFVLGAPKFYQRFGFSPDMAAGFDCEYAGPYFMAMWLGEVRSVNSMQLVYPNAFAGLD